MAINPQEVNDASEEVIRVARQLRALSAGMIDNVAGSVKPHDDTIAALKAEAIGTPEEPGPAREWETVRDALSSALTP